MTSSYVDLFGIQLQEDGHVEIGDVAVSGQNATPRYVVVALTEHRAWVRNEAKPWEEFIVDRIRLRKIS